MISILKSKQDKMLCHLAKICFETIFFTSFSKISFADLQSTLKTKILFIKSS